MKISWAGVGITLLVLTVVPFIWAIPMALVSAELTSMYPENGGLYVWTTRGLGEMPGFLASWGYFLCCIVSTAVFLALVVSYIENFVGGVSTPVRVLISRAIVLVIA